MLLRDLQVPLHTIPTVWWDNEGALALASNPTFHVRTLHIKVDNHQFISEKVLNKDMSLQYIPSADQVADVFTKGLNTSYFLMLKDKLMVCQFPMHLRVDVNHYVAITLDKKKKSTTQDQAGTALIMSSTNCDLALIL